MSSQHNPKFLARFWAKVDASGDCWEWTAAVDRGGYGSFRAGGRMSSAHRVVYEILVGQIPAGLHIDHLCRNRRCVNPDHLEPVTRSENARRGISPILASHQTHCKHGHEFTPENTHNNTQGRRCCRTCGRLRIAGYRAKANHDDSARPHA